MYQINEIEGKRLINGYEIQVIGNGQRGLCRVSNGNGIEKYNGTYAECVKWLVDRKMLVK